MSLDLISTIADVIGAAAVVAALLYLACQIRGSTRASVIESKLQTTRLMTEALDIYIQQPQAFGLLQRAFRDGESLTEDEVAQFNNLALRMFAAFSGAHFQYRKGAIEQADWQEVVAGVHFWLRARRTRKWWDGFGRAFFGAEFQAFIDHQIQTAIADQIAQDATPPH